MIGHGQRQATCNGTCGQPGCKKARLRQMRIFLHSEQLIEQQMKLQLALIGIKDPILLHKPLL